MKRRFECTMIIAGLMLVSGCEIEQEINDRSEEKPKPEFHVREDGVAGLTREQTLPDRNLRGFGKVSGVLWNSPEGSILQINCEETQDALLTHAKYLSDLRTTSYELEKVTIPDTNLSAWQVEGQGVVSALCEGTRVFIIASSEIEGLVKLIRDGFSGEVAKAESEPKAEVPMWLDRWDQYGFRFYYRPWERPKSGAFQAENYDVSQEFEFAEQSDRSGFVFWATTNQVDTAEGMTNYGYWNFAAKAAAAKKLPVGLNIMTGGPGMSWFHNRYRDQGSMKMPQYCGTYHEVANDYFGGSGFVSWNATTAKDANLGIIQDFINESAAHGNLTTILEPHGELKHGDYDLFMEYGPIADRGFQSYLKTQYNSLAQLNTAWGTSLKSWEEARVPEVASFLGWGKQAFDLTGQWRIQQEPEFEEKATGAEQAETTSSKAPKEWFEADFDDSSWPAFLAPGHDRTMFLPKKPAVYRQTIDLPATWIQGKKKVYLYCWDLNRDWHQPVLLYINGKLAAEDKVKHPVSHYMAVDVTAHLQAGKNQITLRLPSGYLAYRIYLSPDEPLQYPALGKEKNALWVDFMGWIRWSRVEMARRGMEMIRQAQPDIQIDLMAPDGYEDGVKQLAQRYGGNFKNTGYMGAFWADHLPSQMRSAGLPFSLEPGGPASTLEGFKKQLGLYHTEGLNGIDYFIHIGSVMWPDDIRAHFQKTLKTTRLIGKYHPPQSEVAFFWGTKNKALQGYPWGTDPDVNLPSAYNCKDTANQLLWRGWPRDNVSESDFANGNANQYKVIIDTNTSIMTEEQLKGIEDYVRQGGTFLTFIQTGRHTPTETDTWKISTLTGYKVLSWDLPVSDQDPGPQPMKPAPGQEFFTQKDGWVYRASVGLRLEKVAPDAQDLLHWNDGTVAAGMRSIGKGRIIHFGPRNGTQWWPGVDVDALESILRNLNISQVPAHFEKEQNGKDLLMRHYVTNNGLYHVWAVWNQNPTESRQATLVFDDQSVARGVEVETGGLMEFPEKGTLAKIDFEPLQTRLFLTPRQEIKLAPLRWFELQRNWWRASSAPPQKALPKSPHRFSVDLSGDWAFRPLDDGEDGAAFVAPAFDDSSWQKIRLDIWTMPDQKDLRRAVIRKTFTIPSSWKDGDAEFWLQSWQATTFIDRGRVWMDGKLIRDWNSRGIEGVNPEGSLQAGTTHTVAVEIDGNRSLVGSRGTSWLWFWPKAAAEIDLAGEWETSQDVMRYENTVTLPGEYRARSLRRTVSISREHEGRNVLIDITADGQLLGVLCNGKWVRRFHHIIGTRFQLNVTPWVNFGGENEIELIHRNEPGRGEIKVVKLKLYAPDQPYP